MDENINTGISEVREDHPMIDLLTFYYRNFDSLKSAHVDMSNIDFQREYGITLIPPSGWPYVAAIKSIVEESARRETVIVYSDAQMYTKLYEEIGNGEVSYCSWYEIYHAVNNVQSNPSPMRHFKDLLSSANLVIIIGSPAGLLDQIRGHCEQCLIVLG